jgi:hypothetical protein
MTDITDDVIEDFKAAGFPTNLMYQWQERLAKFISLQRQRERQAVAVPDGMIGAWAFEAFVKGKWVVRVAFKPPPVESMSEKERNEFRNIQPLYLAPPADTVKQEASSDTKRMDFIEAHSKDMGNYTELRIAIHDGEKWHGTLRKAIDAAMSDCPHPIVEELTK